MGDAAECAAPAYDGRTTTRRNDADAQDTPIEPAHGDVVASLDVRAAPHVRVASAVPLASLPTDGQTGMATHNAAPAGEHASIVSLADAAGTVVSASPSRCYVIANVADCAQGGTNDERPTAVAASTPHKQDMPENADAAALDAMAEPTNSQRDAHNPPILTVYLYLSDAAADDPTALAAACKRMREQHIHVVVRKAADPPLRSWPRDPYVYMSVGASWAACDGLARLPLHARRRWMHFAALNDVLPEYAFYCWLKATDPLPPARMQHVAELMRSPSLAALTRASLGASNDEPQPLVSVFTPAYRSRDKILRPYRSLRAQTYSNWEWVIVDDSGDDERTYREALLPLDDPRIRRFRQEARSGYIGDVKRQAASLCTGEILVEVDHDDDLTPDCLQRIVSAARRHPECGFFYSDCCETWAENGHPHWYGWDCGFGFGMAYRVWVPLLDRWQNACRTPSLNWRTIRHLMGLANHPRAWTRECYHLVGGHRGELSVADDYDLIVRTFLCTRMLRIPHMTYIQYRNHGWDNFTSKRNKQIQTLVAHIGRYYGERIDQRLTELGMPRIDAARYARVWTTGEQDALRVGGEITDFDPNVETVVFPLPDVQGTPACGEETAGDADKAQQAAWDALAAALAEQHARGWQCAEFIVVGMVPPVVEAYAREAPPGAIRWWQMERGCGLLECTRYALMLGAGGGMLTVRNPPSTPPEASSVVDGILAARHASVPVSSVPLSRPPPCSVPSVVVPYECVDGVVGPPAAF